MRSLLLLALLALTAPTAAQHSLFDQALLLDSLYERVLDGEDHLAQDFFTQLRQLYPNGDQLTDEVVARALTDDNYYLAPKVNYVRSQLTRAVDNTAAVKDSLEWIRYYLEEATDSVLQAACPDYLEGNTDACPFASAIEEFADYARAADVSRIRRLITDADEPERYRTVDDFLAKVEPRLYELDVTLDKLAKQQEAALSLYGSAETAEFLTGGSAVADRGFAAAIAPPPAGSVQGAVIDGASRWIAERMREELSIAFFDRFENWLDDRNVGTLFPATVDALTITATTDYSLMLQVLRSAFERDLQALPFNVGPFLRREISNTALVSAAERRADSLYVLRRGADMTWSALVDLSDDDAKIEAAADAMNDFGQQLYFQEQELQKLNQEFNYVLLTVEAIHQLSQGTHVADLLNRLGQQVDELFPNGGRIRPALVVLDVLTRSFVRTDPERGTTWLRRADLERLTRDQQLREFYFGLVANAVDQQYGRRRADLLARRKAVVGNLPYFGGAAGSSEYTPAARRALARLAEPEVAAVERQLELLEREERFLDRILKGERRRRYDKEPWIGNLLNEVSLFTERMDNLQQQYVELRRSGQANLGNAQLVQLLQHSLEILEPVLQIALPNQTEKIATIRSLTNNVLGAYTGVLNRDYDAVVLGVIPVAGTLLDVDYTATLERGDLIDASALTAAHGTRKRKLQEIFRYSAFLAAVAESRSPEDIKQAIRAIALPTGSYSIKRRSFANVSLNTYPGLTGGLEVAQSDTQRELAPNFGFTAPVGLAFSWGFRSRINDKKYLSNPRYRRRVDRSPDVNGNRYLNGHSGSLFFPLVDLGAVVLFRLDGSTNSLPEDVGFQQVFSPGVVYSHGFPGLPISVLAGAQVSPQLRKFGDEPADAIRFNLGVTVDLPMANFYTRRVEKEK